MKDQIQTLAETVKTEIAAIRRIKTTTDTFLANQAALQAEAARFVDEHDFSLDTKSATKVATLNGGIALAKACTPRILRLVVAALENAIHRSAGVRNGLGDIYRELDRLIEDSLLAKVPEDLREGVDVLATSKAYRAEVTTRMGVSDEPRPHTKFRDELPEAAISLAYFLEYFERCDAELARCRSVARQYGA
jgi:hypothetical protein